MRTTGVWLVSGLAILALDGCASRQSEPQHPTAPRPARGPVLGAALSSSDYVATAASIDLFAIRSSELARQRSGKARLRDLAAMMTEAHQGTSAQLSFAGRRVNLLPSAVMLPNHQSMMDALAVTSDFDALFLRDQIQIHEQALQVHRAYAARGSSPTLRASAASAAPIISEHLRLLRAF